MKFSRIKAINTFNVLLFIVALIQYYLLTPLNVPAENYITTAIGFDKIFKLIPGFLIPYLSIYILLGFLMYMVIRVKENSEVVIFLMAITLLWSFVNFAHGIFPTINNLRPVVKDGGIFFDFVNDLYSSVKPFRTMPSWHAATAALCAIIYYRMDFKRRIPVIVWCVLIVLSPLFLKMASVLDVFMGISLAFISFSLAQKISITSMKSERVHEVVKTFSLESLMQSIAIGIRDSGTLNSLIENLTRIEKSLTPGDKEDINKLGSGMNPPVDNLKQIINNMIVAVSAGRQIEKAEDMYGKAQNSHSDSHSDQKKANIKLMADACAPFENPDFRSAITEIKKRNSQLINTNSMENAAKERSQNVIFRFKSFLESHKKDIPALRSIAGKNGHKKITLEEIKVISRELRMPPYEISPDEVWNAYLRLDNTKVKPLTEKKNPSNIISLTQYALGKADSLEPFGDTVDANFNEWIEANKLKGKIFNQEEMIWLTMMKSYFSSFLEIQMSSFEKPPFIGLGGAAHAYNVFGQDLNRILHELNETLI